ncbi:MAG: DUF3347 domain-containing protein [Pedobacter sp.]|nr:MAG: DUF3347 domain-containing protein [Pedobacter sp.]
MRYQLSAYALIGAFLLFSSCSNSDTKVADATTEDSVVTKPVAVQVVLKNGDAQALYNDYLVVKNALVNSSAEAASSASMTMVRSAVAAGLGTRVIGPLEKIADSKDLKIQRQAFTSLNNELIAYFKKADLTSGKIYIQHCPMANNGDGGDWLAGESNIRNPYYGDEMMECGAVIEEIKAK